VAEKTSIWKKEIHLRRSRSGRSANALPAPAKQSIWKKEIHLRRPAKPVVLSAVPAPAPLREGESWPTEKRAELWEERLALEPELVAAPVVEPAFDFEPWPQSEPALMPEPEPEPDPEPAQPEPSSQPEARRPREKRERRTGRGGGELVGLRVGSSQIAAAHVSNGRTTELVKFARGPIATGIVADGEVRDPDALAQALKRFFDEHKLPRGRVRLGIATNRIGVRVLDVPKIDDPKMLENAIRFRVQEVLPIPLADAVLDHIVLGDLEGGDHPTSRVLVAFAHRELIDRYVEACKRARIKLVGIDFDAFALLRALSDDSAETEHATVAVAIGRERTIFAVAEHGVCDFTRVLEWGGSSLDVVLARTLDLTPSQAEPLKQAITLDGDTPNTELSPVQLEAGRAAIRDELQLLARELLSSLQYYQSRPGSLAIAEVLLAGGGSQLIGIAPELERLLGVPVRAADSFAQVKLGKKVKRPADPGSLAIAIGLGIER
jgi:type IV pilus assembly protein PilM